MYKKAMGIYMIKNLKNSKLYVGQTGKSLNERKNNHLWKLKKQIHLNKHLQNAYNKYGKENFIFEIIEEIEDEKLLTERENYWINFYKSNKKEFGYNKREAVDSNLGIEIHDKEWKEMMQKRMTGKNNPMHGVSLIPWNKGIKWEQMSVVQTGEGTHFAKLTWERVGEIREKYATGEYDKKLKLLAEEYNVSVHSIWRIVNNVTWSIKKNKDHPKKKRLNFKIAEEIRKEFATGKYSQKELAEMFKTSPSNIGRVINNKVWTEDHK